MTPTQEFASAFAKVFGAWLGAGLAIAISVGLFVVGVALIFSELDPEKAKTQVRPKRRGLILRRTTRKT